MDAYIADMWFSARINSPLTVTTYRYILRRHKAEMGDVDFTRATREDIVRALGSWSGCGGSTRRLARSVLVCFYGWAVTEGLRPDNPAAATRPVRYLRRPLYRLTHEEAGRVLAAARSVRERRAVYLAMGAGLRVAELCGLQGKHFQRPGWIWVAAEIAKGQRERWIPVLPDLVPIVEEIRADVASDSYVFRHRERPISLASCCNALRKTINAVGERAGIHARVGPQTLRHAFGDHVARGRELLIAQTLMGHSSIGTTLVYYIDPPSLDELADAVKRVRLPWPTTGTTSSLRRSRLPMAARWHDRGDQWWGHVTGGTTHLARDPENATWATDELLVIERRIIERLKELRPAVDEYCEHEQAARRLGLQHDTDATLRTAATTSSRGRKAARATSNG